MLSLRVAAGIAAIFACLACSEAAGPSTGANLSRMVVMGTALSMGFTNDGVDLETQGRSWPKLLADEVGAKFSLPLIKKFGCSPPLKSPTISNQRTDGNPATSHSCSPNVDSVRLPTQNLAFAGATVMDAVSSTGSSGGLISRVLLPGQTQVSAMRAQKPTFVSVEFGMNEAIVPSLSGIVTTTPFATFAAAYQQVIDSVKATGAKAVLFTLMDDVSKFPGLRVGSEIAVDRQGMIGFNVGVNANCTGSPNFVSMLKIVSLVEEFAFRLGKDPADLSCADVPGVADGVLTPADITVINGRIAEINAFIKAKAAENGYATVSLGELYDSSKLGVLFSAIDLFNAPGFGPRISVDAINPNAFGQQVLKDAAKAAIIAKYGAINR